MEHESSLACGACIRKPPSFDNVVTAALYLYPIDWCIRQWKLKNKPEIGKLLTHELAQATIAVDKPDALIPVPTHWRRRLARGFDHSRALGAGVSQLRQIPLITNALRRVRHSAPQRGLTLKERQKNLRKSIVCNVAAKQKQLPEHVALVDDVMTTGSTVSLCARELKRAGVCRVDVWVIARA